MTNATREAPQSGSVFWRLYMLGWVGLAGAALIYLSAAVFKPDLLKPLSPQIAERPGADPDIVSTKLETLERSISSLENKLANVETTVRQVASASPEAQPTETGQTEQRTASAPDASISVRPVETETVNPATEKAVVKTGKVPPLPARAPQRKQIATAQVSNAEGSNNQDPAIPLVILNGVAAAGISTGSVNDSAQPQVSQPQLEKSQLPEIVRAEPEAQPAQRAPAIAFGAPTVEAAQNVGQAAGTSNAIVVSVAGSVDQLRSDWDLLVARHPQLLRSLQPRYDIMAADGPYRLLAGPLKSKSEAGQLCSALQLHGVTCDIEDNFLGNAL